MDFLQSGDQWMGLFYAAVAGVVLYLWIGDYRNRREEGSGFPGATPAAGRLLWIAGIGGVVLTLLETLGESWLGLTAEQTEIAALAIFPLLAAAIVEEIVFRGYLVVSNKGWLWLCGSIVLFSALFALIHPYLWEWEDGNLSINFTTKAWFSTGFIFVNSLWFYTVRFAFGNHSRSLLPCFVAHAASNGMVFVVKAVQGYVTW